MMAQRINLGCWNLDFDKPNKSTFITMQLHNKLMKPLKKLCFASLGMFYATSSCLAAPQTPPKVLLAQVQTDKISQVKSGALKTAHASWWGFDKADATGALQNAINSGVPKLIVDNMGSDWIVNKPIQLVSNQQIVFEDGVVIQAQNGMFKGKKDPLFDAQKLTNIQLIGEGNVTFRMHRADYDNRKLYDKAEWRHGISLRDCSNVVIRGLTVEETGGDGLYLGASASGFNKNVVGENCKFDKNYRQGISVISAEDLTIRNCKLNNTDGTAPQAGIDFEPNASGQRIVNCLLENCEISGNTGGGVDFAIRKLEEPVSITIDKCKISGNNGGGIFSSIQGDSTVVVRNSRFDNDRITLRNARPEQRFVFKDCVVDFSNAKASDSAPTMLTARHDLRDSAIGNIKFEKTKILVNKGQEPLGFNLLQGSFGSQSYGITLSDDLTGTLQVEEDNESRKVDVKKYVKQKREELKLADPGYLLKQKYADVQTQDLTQQWKFLPDAAEDQNVTMATFDDSSWKPINAGDWWQKQGFPYHGKAWYRKKITLPALAKNQKAFLYFDGVDGSAQVYVNGQKVGQHILAADYTGWNLPFNFDVTDALQAGENVIAIQVTSKSIDTASGINQPIHLGIGTVR